MAENSIRLACLYCDREDCDGVDAIPLSWTDIFCAAGEEWWTHLGVCPECNAAGCNR